MSIGDNEFEALLTRANEGDQRARVELALTYLRQSQYGRARRWFNRAAQQGDGEAMFELGRMELLGLGIAASAVSAMKLFEQAADAGFAAAHGELARMHYQGIAGSQQRDRAASHLDQAVRGGDAKALRVRAMLFAEKDEQHEASACFLAAARRGDAYSQHVVAQRYVEGVGLPENPGYAVHWARQARDNGSYCQQHFFETADAGEAEADSSADLDLGEIAPTVFEDPQPHPADIPHADSTVRVFDDLYRREECEYLIETTAPWLRGSTTIHPETGESIRSKVRSSDGWSIAPDQEDIVIIRFKERLALQSGLPATHTEAFAMLRYRPGQEYRRHFDYIDPRSGEAGWEIQRNGQRVKTIFSYLRDVPEGGETEFPVLDIKVTPRAGRAVLFDNVDANGEPDPDSLHASLPVIKGEKWLATLWIRDKPLNRK